MPPQPLTAVGSTFGSAHHFDQFGRVTGELVVNGERLDIDCLGMRDRTWGPRPEHRPRQAAYVTGAASAEHSFLAVTNTRPDGRPGRLRLPPPRRQDGEPDRRAAGGAAGPGRGLRDPGRDRGGRRGRTGALRAVGTPVSKMIINRHTFIDINSLIRWDLDGDEAWGEDQDMWPITTFADRQRQARS